MGIENREYLREDYDEGSRRFHKQSASIVVKLIIVTVAVYVLQLLTIDRGGSSLAQQWLELKADSVFFQGQIWRLLTYAFCHSQEDLLHLVFNMMVLYSIGGILRELLGDREFLWFYLVSAVFAGICSLAVYSIMAIPVVIVGASGATMAIFCTVAMHYPRQKVFVMGLIPVEFRWLLLLFVALDSMPIITGQIATSKVANAAHLGGLVFGFLYFRWSMRLTRWWDQFAGRIATKRRANGKLKLFAPPTQPDANIDEQVDKILEKISREGEASLTTRERNILTQASKQLRKDRG